MKPKILFSLMFVLICTLLYVPASYSQNPTFNYILINDALTTTTITNDTYQVDLIIRSTDVNPIEFATGSFGFSVNLTAVNGGTLTASFVPGSSELTNTAQIPASFNAATTSGNFRIIKINGKTPPGTGNGSLLSNVAPGTRIGRLQLKNTATWITPINIDTSLRTLYSTSVSAYVSGINTNIWSSGTLVMSTTLPVELSSFVSNVNGRQVNLNWETKTEVNFNKFEIDRALVSTKDATVTWVSVGLIRASGTSNSPKKYSYTEKNLQAGKYQYRLKMIDNDGTFKYSKVVETEVALPKNFELSQNYPNPFNPSTRINYSIPFDSRVILEVYNITGEKMGQIVNEEQSAGYYTANFSSSALNRSIASGVYIYKLNAVDKSTGNVFTSIKKMMLLK